MWLCTPFAEVVSKKNGRAQPKKLDMGKACIRFKKPEDVPLNWLRNFSTKITAQEWIDQYEAFKQQHVKSKRNETFTGLGGFSSSAMTHANVKAWYEKHLGMKGDQWGFSFQWKALEQTDVPAILLRGALLAKDSNYFSPSENHSCLIIE